MCLNTVKNVVKCRINTVYYTHSDILKTNLHICQVGERNRLTYSIRCLHVGCLFSDSHIKTN